MTHHLKVASQNQTRDERIRAAQNAVIDRMTLRPDVTESTCVTSGRIEDGLTCLVEQGRFATRIDMSRGMGGDATAPSPGFFGRAAVVGCVAIGVKMFAARSGLTFDAVDVSVEMDFDDSAIFGLGDRSAAPLETRISVEVTTSHHEDLVRDVVDRVLEMDPWFLALRDPQSVTTTLAVQAPI